MKQKHIAAHDITLSLLCVPSQIVLEALEWNTEDINRALRQV